VQAEPESPGARPAASSSAASSTLTKLRARVLAYRSLLAWLAALVLLAFSARILLGNPEPLRRLAHMPGWMWAVLLPLMLVNVALAAWRMSLSIVQSGGPHVPARAWFRIAAIGQFLNVLVPQLGNVYRGVTLKREFQVSYLTYSTGLFTFVWLDTTTGFGLGLVALALLAPGLSLAGVPVLPTIAFGLVAMLAAPAVAFRVLALLRPRGGFLLRAQSLSSQLLQVAARSLGARRFLLEFTLVSALVMLDQAAVLWLCFHAVGLPIDVATATLFHIVVKLSNTVVVTPGNLGVTELAFGALGASAHGGSVEHGIAAALAFRMLFSLVAIGLGLGYGGFGLIRSTRAASKLPSSKADATAREKNPGVSPAG
jgi:uncharacterized membrane protein YbhN (UPF0104 family)